MTVELVVPEDAGGARLDRFLAENAEIGSRAAAARLIDTGAVRVDGQVRPRAHRVAAGAVVELTIPEPQAAPLPAEDVAIVYSDDRLLVVNLGSDLEMARVPEPLIAPPFGRRWKLKWSSEDARYGPGAQSDKVLPAGREGSSRLFI